MIATAALAAAGAAAGCTPHAAAPPGDPFVAAYRRLEPSVVLFTMTIPSDDPKKRRRGERDDAYGSGVAIASTARSTTILTVAHVVQDAKNLRARLDDGRTLPARVVAREDDPDVALVSVPVGGVPVARLGRSAGIAAGTAVGVAGYPIPDAFEDEHLGTKPSVFGGRISSVRRDAVELDLPIIPGESGGPVFDVATGDVIALAESRFDDEKAIGFGVPIEDAESLLRARGSR